jgi:hypothetical protein
MVVERLNPKDIWEDSFTCQDLVTDHQKWRAYEFDTMFNRPNDWRIATNNDIVNYLSRFVDIPLGRVGEYYVAKLIDDGIMLESLMLTDRDVNLKVEELADLKRIIDERVG